MQKFCPYCGKPLSERSKFCPSCGKATPARQQPAAVAVDERATQPMNPPPVPPLTDRARSRPVVARPASAAADGQRRRLAPPTYAFIGSLESAGFGLRYGAIDLIVTPEGRIVFLELNPTGQYLWIEQATGLPISLALAELLAGKVTR